LPNNPIYSKMGKKAYGVSADAAKFILQYAATVINK
jgi:hypothetical protein